MQIVGSEVDLTDWYNTELIHFHFQIIIFFLHFFLQRWQKIVLRWPIRTFTWNTPESFTTSANFPSADDWKFAMFLVQPHTVIYNNIHSYHRYLCFIHHHQWGSTRRVPKAHRSKFPVSFVLSSEFLAVVLRTSKAIRLIKSLPSPAEQTRSVQADHNPLNDQWSLFESLHWLLLLEGMKDEWRERKLQKRCLDSENVREIMRGRVKRGGKKTWIEWISPYYTTGVSPWSTSQ